MTLPVVAEEFTTTGPGSVRFAPNSAARIVALFTLAKLQDIDKLAKQWNQPQIQPTKT